MTALAEELDRRLRTLDPERAARFEKLVRSLLALIDEAPPVKQRSAAKFVTQTHHFGLKQGIDPTRLGQLADDL